MTNKDFFRALTLAAMTGTVLGIAPACGGSTRTSADGSGGDGSGGDGSGGDRPSANGGVGGTGNPANTGGAAGGARFLSADRFDRSCNSIADCAPVHDGDQCGCAQCPTAAINTGAIDEWETAKAKLACPEVACDPVAILCEPKSYTCRNNRCIVVEAPNIFPQLYDRTCRENEDCAIIPIGRQCAGICDCSAFGAVSQAGYKQAIADASEIACATSQDDCYCPLPPPEAAGCVFFAGSSTGECRISSSIVPPAIGTQYADNYDQRCTADDECRVVAEGQQCCMDCARYAAISFGAVSTWESDLSLIECDRDSTLPCPGAPTKPSGCPRVNPMARCVSGRCGVEVLDVL